MVSRLATEKERFIIELERDKIEMEHAGIVETRNAMLIALVTIPFAILTIAHELNLIANNGQLLVVAFVAAFAAKLIYDYIIDYNGKLRNTQAKIDQLILRAREVGSRSESR
jgi:hypothetical protein